MTSSRRSGAHPPGAPAPGRIDVIAHRGASEDAPEHTLAAYRQAIEDGADGLECDVRLTADGHLVCVHDRRVNRTSNGRGAVSALELAELAELDFGSWKTAPGTPGTPGSRRGTGVREHDPWESPDSEDRARTAVLTLERLLQLVADADRPVELAIETKHPTKWAGQVEERVLELLDRFRLTSPVRIMSFSARSLHRVRLAAPHLPTVLLLQLMLPRMRDGRLPYGIRVAAPSIRLLRAHPEYVAHAHAAGNQVHVWTVDDPADWELCALLGVDAVITNRPRAARAALDAFAP